MNKKLLIIIFSIIGIIIILFTGLRFLSPNIKQDFPKLDESVTYENRIFDDSYVHLVEVTISDEDWQDLLANPTKKTKYKCDVKIDGIEFKNVAFSTKGNSSLNRVAEAPKKSERYSFKINFGKYVEDQTYYGLDILHLNNTYNDATYMKDYMSYEMFKKIGIPAPLASYTFIKINNKNHGLYISTENIGESFLKRNNLSGNLYKPEQEKGDNGASLKYTDDNISSYPNIFDNNETEVSEEDNKRLISSLKTISEKNNIETVIDTDELIKYYVVHNFLLNYDSYTGSSIHNYYLYEDNGKLSFFPWDYNMSQGAFAMTEDETFIVNYGIDSPLYKAKEEDRPLWNWIINNETYLNKYHEEYDKFLKEYLENNEFNNKVDETYNLINKYINADRTKFYKNKQINDAVKEYKEFNNLRTQSIRLQLSGKLATKTKQQKDNNKIDASKIKLQKMGEQTGKLEDNKHEKKTNNN